MGHMGCVSVRKASLPFAFELLGFATVLKGCGAAFVIYDGVE